MMTRVYQNAPSPNPLAENSARCKEEAGREPEISRLLNVLDREIHLQTEVGELLAARLEPAMSLLPPDAKGSDCSKANEPTCVIAGMLAEMARRVSLNTSRLQALIHRLEF